MKTPYVILFSFAAILTNLAQAQQSDSPVYPNENAAYSFFVRSAGVQTASYWMPCYHPDPGNETNYHVAEYWVNKRHSSLGG